MSSVMMPDGLSTSEAGFASGHYKIETLIWLSMTTRFQSICLTRSISTRSHASKVMCLQVSIEKGILDVACVLYPLSIHRTIE